MFKRIAAAGSVALILAATTGCATNQAEATLMAGADLGKVKTVYVVHEEGDDHHLHDAQILVRARRTGPHAQGDIEDLRGEQEHDRARERRDGGGGDPGSPQPSGVDPDLGVHAPHPSVTLPWHVIGRSSPPAAPRR